MANARKTIEHIYNNLSNGYVELALLGESDDSKLQLDSFEGRSRYAAILRPNIEAVIAKNKKTELLLFSFLIILFFATILLTAYVAVKQIMLFKTVGISVLIAPAYFSIDTIKQMSKENDRLRLIPEFLPLLKMEDAQRIIAGFLEKKCEASDGKK